MLETIVLFYIYEITYDYGASKGCLVITALSRCKLKRKGYNSI